MIADNQPPRVTDLAARRRAAEAERALIGGLLLGGADAYRRVVPIVEAEQLVESRHRAIYHAIAALAERGDYVDGVTVAHELDCTGTLAEAGLDEIADLVQRTPSTVNVEAYARIVAGDSPRAGSNDAWPPPLDLSALLAVAPIAPRMIIDNWLPAGYATLLAGHGGAGKSSLALHLAVCVATGRPWWGLPCASRRVLYLSCEDRADVLHWRLDRICRYEGIAADDLASLHLIDLVGHEAILFRRDSQLGAHVTGAYHELSALMTKTGTEVLFVDGVSDTYGGSENDRGEVKSYVNALVRLIGTDGAVVLLHHVNRTTASAGTTTEGYSGSTGWHNSVRARWYLHPEMERTDEGAEPTGNLALDLQKSNLGRTDRALRIRWDDDAHMFVAEAAVSRGDREVRDEEEQHGIECALRAVIEAGDYCPAATTGNRTAYHVLSSADGFPDSLKGNSNANRRRFWRHIEALRRMGVIEEGSIRRKNRTLVATLTLKATQGNACTNAPNECDGDPRDSMQGAPAPMHRMVHGGYRGRALAHGEDSGELSEGIPWQ